jgi:hypothetical protein
MMIMSYPLDPEIAMRIKVTDQGVLIPKQWFEGIDEVAIHRERDVILIEPILGEDPILSLGTQPIAAQLRLLMLRSIMTAISPSYDDHCIHRHQLSAGP